MKKKVLIIDDDEGILEALALLLEEEGYAIKTTLRGDESLEVARLFKPDVILLDILLSGSDGRLICKQLKQEGSTKKIPVIMLSAHLSAEANFSECGAEAFLAKPFETEDLLLKIESLTLREEIGAVGS